MVGVAGKTLSTELFSDADASALEGLLGGLSAEPNLPAPVLKFIQQVGGVLEGAKTAGKTVTQPTFIVSPEPEAPAGERVIGSPDKKTKLRPVLSDYLRQHPGMVLNTGQVAGDIHENYPQFTVPRIRKEVARLKRLEYQIEGGKVVGGYGKLKFVPETSPQGAGNVSATAKPAVARTITLSALPDAGTYKPTTRVPSREIAPPTPPTYSTETARIQRPVPYQSAPREPQPAVEVYTTRLNDAIKGLGKREQDAVMSYVSMVLDDEPGQTDGMKAGRAQLQILADFTDSFLRIQNFEGLPSELYDVLGGISGGNMTAGFQDGLRRAKDSFDVLNVVSTYANSPYALRVRTIMDIYREDVGLEKLLRKADGFHTDMVAARNKIPRLRAGQFYETIKKIEFGINWGSRYRDVLKLAETDPREAVKFFGWASALQTIAGHSFDSVLAKYMRLGNRAQPITENDLEVYPNYSR